MILKSDSELATELPIVKQFITTINRLQFWKSHFSNNSFRFKQKEFNWEYWDKIPFITKADFLKIGLKERFHDGRALVKENPLRFVVFPTSGTSKQGSTLFLRNVDNMVDGELHSKGKRTLVLFQGRVISLRNTIAMLGRNIREGNDRQSLVINPFKFNETMMDALDDFNEDNIKTFPACIGYLTAAFPRTQKILAKTKKLWVGGDFLSSKQVKLTKSYFPDVDIDLDYITTEADTIGICCKYLVLKHGPNSYHPYKKDRIIELIDIDEYGCGEIVVTMMQPSELSVLRYRTGDMARAVRESCACGSKWTLFLEGRRNMDYIKSVGVLVSRAEIERALLEFENVVEEWRGEVREVEAHGYEQTHITLIIKPKTKGLNKKIIQNMQKSISLTMRLTPKKTLAQLVAEKKVLPLQIKMVKDFPQTAKKVLLKKIVE